MRSRFPAVLLCLTALAPPAAAQSAGPTLTLAEALARARAETPALAAARARRAAATGAVARAGRPLNPFVELRSENWASGLPGGLPLDLFATVTQTLELGGDRAARRDLARAGAGGAAAAEALAWQDVAAAVAGDYLGALRARDEARALEAHAARLAEATRIVASRVGAGAAPEMELLKLRTEEARAVLDGTRARVAAARAAATLGALLGSDVTADALELPAVPPAPAADAPLAAHPEIVAAEAALESARAGLAAERARAVPDVSLTAGWKRTAGYHTGVAAVTLPIPLFDANGVARALAAGQVSAVALDRTVVERRLRGTLAATTHAAATLASRAVEARRQIVEPARQARDAAAAAFAAGALDVLRLVDAERLHLDALLAAIALDVDAVAAAIDARRAAGEDPLP